ncbi:MAG: 50S ribosomal protein L25 [Candidatus Bipolaricaulia bacterium]
MKSNNLRAVIRDRGENPGALRRNGVIPGVIYGADTENRPIAIDRKVLYELLSKITRSSKIQLTLDGDDQGRKGPLNVLIKEIQRDPLTDEVIHIDFYAPPSDREIVVNVPLKLIGKSTGGQQGGILAQLVEAVAVKATFDRVPEFVELDIQELGLGDTLHVRDIELEGAEVNMLPDQGLVTVFAPRREEIVEEVEAEVEAEAAVEGEREGETEEPEGEAG